MVPISSTVIKKSAYLLFSVALTLLSGCSTLPQTSATEGQSPAEVRTINPTEPTNEYILQAEPVPPAKTTQIKPTLPEKKRVKQAVPVPKANTTTAKPSNGAVIALLNNADMQRKQGDLYSAQNNIQRAQRISPNDPHVYYALATIHRDLKDYGLAEQVALKGLSIVQSKPKELKRFWLLLSDIYSRSGNDIAARKAEKEARRI